MGRAGTWWARVRSEWPIAAVMLLILGSRMVPAIMRQDMIWADEHYQTVEPAYGIVHGFWYVSWEWEQGFRTWLVPLLFVPIIFAAKLVGIRGGVVLIGLTRVQMAAMSLLVPLGLDRLGRQLRWSLFARFVMLVVLLGNTGMAIWAPATLSDTIATALLWGMFPIAYDSLQRGHGIRAGVLASLPFLARPHMAVCALVFGLLTVAFRRTRAQTLRVLIGGLIVFAVLAIADWIAWGVPAQSVIKQVTEGFEIASKFSSDPWDWYFPKLLENLGLLPVFGAIAMLAIAGVLARLRGARFTLDSPLTWIALPCLAHVIVHCAIKHKELRFIEPAFPVLFLCIGLGVEELHRFVLARRPNLAWRGWRLGAVAIAIVAAVLVSQRARVRPVDLTESDTAALADVIYQSERDRAPSTYRCVLAIGLPFWVQRGAMSFGRPWPVIERDPGKVDESDLRACEWIIFHRKHRDALMWRAHATSRELAIVGREPNGWTLAR